MVQSDEVAYLMGHETSERAAAAAATTLAARDAHFMMAERYADRAWAISENFSATLPAKTIGRGDHIVLSDRYGIDVGDASRAMLGYIGCIAFEATMKIIVVEPGDLDHP